MSSSPLSSRRAALKSIEISKAGMKFIHQLRDSTLYFEVVQSYLLLLELLSDDDAEIRQGASEIVSFILGTFVTLSPIAASHALAQFFQQNFDPGHLREHVVLSICELNIGTVLRATVRRSEVLFEKERENLWRDEIREFELRLRLLLTPFRDGKSRCPKSRVMWLNQQLTEWVERSLQSVKDFFAVHDDSVFGWNSDTDAFEALAMTFMAVAVWGRVHFNPHMIETLEELKISMKEKGQYPYWQEKFPWLGELTNSQF